MEIRISVRSFVEFLLRSGDIDNRRTGGSEDALADGARIHRMLQRRMGAEYQAEVWLTERIDLQDYAIVIEGRADGIIDDEKTGRVVVDEIKSTYRELKKITVPLPEHLAQAKCYAYMYAKSHEMKEIGVRMTYCNIDTEEIKYFHENYIFSSLEKWFDGLLKQYKKWSDFEYEWKKQRQESIEKISFPFPYREGQKRLVGYVYQTINEHKKLFVEAPTGVGKTISTIYPSIKAIGEGKGDKLFYLTAKTVTGTVARNTFSLLRDHGLKFKTVTLTAKEKICPMEECSCNPEACPFAKGHFDRINDAVYDMLSHEDEFDRSVILEYAINHQVCPFEMALDISLFSDGVICDYNYLFDPYAYLRRFFGEGIKGSYLFLIDEAHNLLERGRDMYSAVLVKEDFLKLREIISPYSPHIARLAKKCNQELLNRKKECESYLVLSEFGSFVNACNKLHGAINNYLDDHDDCPVKDQVLDFYFELSRFLTTYDRMDGDHYVTYTGFDDQGQFFIKEFCVDPSEELKQCMDKGEASVLFSATFLPIQYYKGLLGGSKEDYEVYAKSTFSPDRQIQLIGHEVTSRYLRRGEEEYLNIARYIHSLISAREGNYMVFFPSHAFLESVYKAFEALYGEGEGISLMMQEAYMKEEDREAFLDSFLNSQEVDFTGKIEMEVLVEETLPMDIEGTVAEIEENEQQTKTLLGFCVLGGIFSEGIDLQKDSLIGAIIVGTGLPQVCPEREILKRHFDEQGEDGFDYAYKFPGMNKVLQAAGRVIRTVEDAGIVALLDERFMQSGYRRLFPAEWQHIKPVTIEGAGIAAADFWEGIL
ncbi:MAG: ATP-dependent DNA helicase [Lachnospiraceae bacterium]|nr:ATP-dependent DNA helicase [Lachnospiraceae bacterium]